MDVTDCTASECALSAHVIKQAFTNAHMLAENAGLSVNFFASFTYENIFIRKIFPIHVGNFFRSMTSENFGQNYNSFAFFCKNRNFLVFFDVLTTRIVRISAILFFNMHSMRNYAF